MKSLTEYVKQNPFVHITVVQNAQSKLWCCLLEEACFQLILKTFDGFRFLNMTRKFIPLTLKVLNFWKYTSYCSLKPLWVGHGGSSAGSYLADPTSPIPSHCASIVATSTVRVNMTRKFIPLSLDCHVSREMISDYKRHWIKDNEMSGLWLSTSFNIYKTSAFACCSTLITWCKFLHFMSMIFFSILVIVMTV